MLGHRTAVARSLRALLSGLWATLGLTLVLLIATLTLVSTPDAYGRITARCSGMTPDTRIRWAVYRQDLPLLRSLLAHGHGVDVPDVHRATAVHYAAGSRSIDIATLVASHSRGIDHLDNAGRTPLAIAVIWQGPEATRLLLQRGASPFAGRVRGLTVYEIAQQNGSGHIVAMLEASATASPARQG
jgi:ankyrin repeat protein